MSIENLAKGERQHHAAATEHSAALEKERGIDGRLKDIAERMSTITQRRVSGNVDEKETAEYGALSGDSQLLQKMLVKAKAETKLAAEKVHAAYVVHSEMQAAQNRLQAESEYNALLAKTREIEAVFCQAIRVTAIAGRAVGHHVLGQSFRISEALDRAIRMNVIPPDA